MNGYLVSLLMGLAVGVRRSAISRRPLRPRSLRFLATSEGCVSVAADRTLATRNRLRPAGRETWTINQSAWRRGVCRANPQITIRLSRPLDWLRSFAAQDSVIIAQNLYGTI